MSTYAELRLAYVNIKSANDRSYALYVAIDLGVDRKKSTGVELGVASRVGSILLSWTDPKWNLYTKSNFWSWFVQVDLNWL